ncbi:MAG: heavy metal-associated domain-containing protein [Bacteroidia bacterium]
MKTIKKTTFIAPLILFVLTLLPYTSKAQENKTEEIKIKTSVMCDMCKTTIEKELAFEKGVKKSTVDVESKIVTVQYNPKKTTPDKIRTAISKIGYDADDVPADTKAYKNLNTCCKKDAVH